MSEERAKTLVVVVATRDPARVAEALRAAVGIGLRGDRVAVVPLQPIDPGEPRFARLLAALRSAGVPFDAPVSAAAEADAVEVWT
jgi:hypothetical protein